MAACAKCKKQIPSYVLEKGIRKQVSANRKFCFSCSPYKKHNTKDLLSNKKSRVCICQECGRKYLFKRGQGHTLKKCNSCVQRERRKRLKKELIEYKGGKCIKCGYSRFYEALSFHHRDKSKKDFTVAHHWNRNKKFLTKEVDKCDLLCVRCHIEIHEKKRMAV